MRELSNGDKESREIWSKNHDVITSDRLQKFWSQLTLQEKRMLLRIDKQSLIEQARKNLYCSRCNGLLLEGFAQIVRYARAVQQYGDEPPLTNSSDSELDDIHNPLPDDDILNPAVHPWGGLAATKDGLLTILDIFINYGSMEPLQNVFNCARAREHEREFQFPDACGGRGRGWISQGISTNGRGHTIRETCALHTARLPCDVLIDYWLDLGEEMQISLLQMKEEDFIERLMHRFDSKRFCKDCRRNVIREFKELKELKRMRREPRCTSWFCVADTAFQYEISEDTVQADWHEFFTDTITTYHHFEWAVGTGEGKSDILEFKNVGLSRSVQVNGLDLGDLNSCFITLRAWKSKDRYTEFCVKAHALKGQPCVHRRLLIGDGFVTITKGESIKSFFEIAEEIEEEEDDYALDKDGNDIDGDGPWPQKHAKSPELAREFLLDAATVIFKEQVEKAYREHTAQQNAHSVFVSLALNLLEERIHVACKEIITLEKQMKLLEEEEREKREEEERKERKRIKEKEKKNRRKEKRKGKEKEIENKQVESNPQPLIPPVTVDYPLPTTVELANPDTDHDEITTPCINVEDTNEENLDVSDSSGNFVVEQSKSTRKKLRSKKEMSNWFNSTMDHDNGREKPLNPHLRDCNPKHSDKHKYYQSCACSSKDVYQTPSNKTMPYRGSSVPPRGKAPFKQVWEPVGSRTPLVANKTEENQLSNCDDCDDNSKTTNNSFVSTPMKNSSSSDNCSSCLSSSSSQNTESSSTSDSEDASPHSHKSDDFAGKSKTNEECKATDLLLPNDEVINNNNITTHSQPQANLPVMMHNHSVHMPVYPSPTMYQGTYSEFMPFHHHLNRFIFPSSNIIYNFQPVPYNLTPPLYNEPNNRINVVKAVPNVKASNATPRTQEDSSSFSLFHFGGPVAGPRGLNVSCAKERIACLMESTSIKQYSLFP